MKFELSAGETLGCGILLGLREQLERAVQKLSEQETPPSEAVHEARKAVKRARALLRLSRSALGEALFSRHTEELRALGRQLSAARDRQVQGETLDKLLAYAGDGPYAEAVQPVRAALAARPGSVQLGDDELAGLVQAFSAERERLDGLADTALAGRRRVRSEARRGLRKAVRRFRTARAEAARAPTTVSLHTLRKRVKDLFYAVSFLRPVRPVRLGKLGAALDGLADLLGDEHDLAILAEVLHREPAECGGAVPVALVLQLIARRRDELRREALGVAAGLLGGRARAFATELMRRTRRHERAEPEEAGEGAGEG